MEVRGDGSPTTRRPHLVRATKALTQALPALWSNRISPPHGRVRLGDFGRRPPSLELDQDSVYDVLVRRFLGLRLAAFAAHGLVLGIDTEPGWIEGLPHTADVEVLRGTSPSDRQLAAAATADWVVLDRSLQWAPELEVALENVVARLRPGAALFTLFTGIARAEPAERAPLRSVAPYAARRLHEGCRGLEGVEVEQYGNVTLALAWIFRRPADGLTERELAAVDPAYPLLVSVSASRRGRHG
jgi:hypothetical protein